MDLLLPKHKHSFSNLHLGHNICANGQVLQSRPGVTGLASIVYHKHEATLLERCRTAKETDEVYTRVCIPTKARLDLIYQRHRNTCYDFDLVFQTIGNLFRRR